MLGGDIMTVTSSGHNRRATLSEQVTPMSTRAMEDLPEAYQDFVRILKEVSLDNQVSCLR